MTPDHASNPEELRSIVGGLSSAEARRIQDALRRLRVPAVARTQRSRAVDPETGEVLEARATRVSDSGFDVVELFEVLVPEPFAEISLEVLDATTHEPEGDATEEEILAALEEAPPREPRRRWNRLERGLALVVLVAFAIFFLRAVVEFWSRLLR